MIDNVRYSKVTDCRNCHQATQGTFARMELPKGFLYPPKKQSKNVVLFLLKGKMLINSSEHPNLILHEGQFILQAIGSIVEAQVKEAAECILYEFEEPISLCESRFNKIMEFKDDITSYYPLEIYTPLRLFMEGLNIYLEDDVICYQLINAKRKELVYLLNCYYPLKQLAMLYFPITAYRNTFRFSIKQNYMKVKTVEELATLSGYSVASFRRAFKNTFGEPVYQWILKQKQIDILSDLESSSLSISEICYKYGFDSLSHFSHFCKSYFGQSPRACRTAISKSAE